MEPFSFNDIHITGIFVMTRNRQRKVTSLKGKWLEDPSVTPLVVLLAVRLMTALALPVEGLMGYGDYPHFYDLARLAVDEGGGLPYVGHWVEFPPLFPYLSLVLYNLAGSVEHVYAYLLAILMLFFDLGNLLLFNRLARRTLHGAWPERMTWAYMGFLAIPAFGWWTFEPLVIFFMLLALDLILTDRPILAGFIAGLGFLTKLIPVVTLVVAWRYKPNNHALKTTIVMIAIVLLGFAPLVIHNQEMTIASISSQVAKGSWETVWALLDGNLGTGTFGPIEEHLDVAQAIRPRGQPALIPHWIPTLGFGIIGAWFFLKAGTDGDLKAVQFLTLTWCLFLLWSRGWSPQWLAYLIPLLLLSLPLNLAGGFCICLALVSLLEWPILLSRGRFDLLWLPVVIRTMLLVLLAVTISRVVLSRQDKGSLRGVS